MNSTKTAATQKTGGSLRQSGKQAVMGLAGIDNFHRARIYAHIKAESMRKDQLLLIHQMGKVGSTSIAATLKEMGLKEEMTIFQTHFLSEEGRAFRRQLAIDGYGSWDNMSSRSRQGHIRGDLLYDHLQKMRRDGRRVKVITMVRDPIATNVSAFFHKNEWWPAKLRQGCQDGSADCIEQLRQRFFSWYPHDVPLNWFDMEMLPVFGIDVYVDSFPQDRGYAIYRNEFADVLLMKLEQFDQCGEEATAEFLELDEIHFLRTNTAAEKWYSPLYGDFKKALHLSSEYLDRMYTSRLAQHFYTTAELKSFRCQWQPE